MLWTTPLPGVEKVPTVLEVDGVGVARMMERIDGSWFVLLDYHHGFGNQRRRDCSGYDEGVRGTETWARRHIVRLLKESADRRAKWPVLPVGEQRPMNTYDGKELPPPAPRHRRARR